jgi:hypothetical protein
MERNNMQDRPKWQPFVKATSGTIPASLAPAFASMINNGDLVEVLVNNHYQVTRTRIKSNDGAPDLVHLSICRIDRGPCHDWRDFQRIKNELVGPEVQAVEIYPPESALVDTANQYHLWCIDMPGRWLQIGFNMRAVVEEYGGKFGTTQRPFRDDERPEDLLTIEQFLSLSQKK